MSEEIKPVENQGGCGCGKPGCACASGGHKCGCCCACVRKVICALVLLLVGGIGGYFAGKHCAYSRCNYQRMMCPMAVVTPMAPAEAPSKK